MPITKVKDPVADAPFAILQLTRGHYALVDPEDYELLSRWKWTAKKSFCCFYAIRKYRENGIQHFVLMHRFLAETPVNMVCHHNNGNSVDNRRANLLNMTPYDHKMMFSWR